MIGRFDHVVRAQDSRRRGSPHVAPEAVDAALHHAWFYRKPRRDPLHPPGPGHVEGRDLVEMKVQVPQQIYIKLHGLKLLNNQAVSVSVNIALARFFRAHPSIS